MNSGSGTTGTFPLEYLTVPSVFLCFLFINDMKVKISTIIPLMYPSFPENPFRPEMVSCESYLTSTQHLADITCVMCIFLCIIQYDFVKIKLSVKEILNLLNQISFKKFF